MAAPVTGRRRVEILESAEAVGARGAGLFLAAARQSLAERGRFTVAFSGGSSPIPLFRRLANEIPCAGIDWSRVHVFWVDERCVPPDHPDSNFRLADELFLSRLPAPGASIHRIAGELLPEDAARRYDADLAAVFSDQKLPRFDLVFLGVGNDGHTASLFPGMTGEDMTGRNAVAVYVEKLRSHRVTMTLPVLNAACHVVFLVTGAGKAEIVADILAGAAGAAYPAAHVMPGKGKLTWLLDKDAAMKLK